MMWLNVLLKLCVHVTNTYKYNVISNNRLLIFTHTHSHSMNHEAHTAHNCTDTHWHHWQFYSAHCKYRKPYRFKYCLDRFFFSLFSLIFVCVVFVIVSIMDTCIWILIEIIHVSKPSKNTNWMYTYTNLYELSANFPVLYRQNRNLYHLFTIVVYMFVMCFAAFVFVFWILLRYIICYFFYPSLSVFFVSLLFLFFPL